MESTATLSILQTQDGFFFQLVTPTASRPWPAQAATGLVGFNRLDPGLQAQLEKFVDVAAETLQILHPPAEKATLFPNPDTAKSFERLGGFLFSLLPPTIQQGLSALPEHLPIVLATNNTELPWELLHDGIHYLALKHPIGRRWLFANPARRPTGPGPHRRAFLFISNPEGDLPEADGEVQALMDAFDSAPELIDTEFLCHQQATRLAVREALASGQYAVIHYSGHTRRGALKLADGELTAAEIQQTLRGEPFIFLNACQSARNGMGQTRTASIQLELSAPVGGLASAFLLGGAVGFMGGLWNVFDTTSRQFAEQFYASVREGMSVGEALQLARSQLFPDPLWASFVLYADPTLRIAGIERREKRLTTLLVARLSGREPLYETLGLETAADVESQAIDLLAQAAARYGGQVYGPPTDSLCIRFGIPKAHDDDAERALRAALNMLRSLRAFNDQRAGSGSAQLGLHIGVSSGQVIGRQIRTTEGSEYQMAGHVVAIAAGLASFAREGQILVDEATCRRTRLTFTFEAVGPLALAEERMPIDAFRVVATKGTLSPVTELFGRRSDLAQLQNWWREASAGQGRLVGLSGAAGVGKTHFTHAFKETLAGQEHRWILATCQSYDQDTPYSLLSHVISGWAEIMPEDDETARRKKLENRMRQVVARTGAHVEAQVKEGLALLGQIVGTHFAVPTVETLDPKLRQRKLAGVLQAVLTWQTAQCPLLLILDDLHWADEASLAVLGQVIGAMGQMPLLVLAIYRSDWAPEWTRWSHYRHLLLEELDSEAQRDLLARQLGGERLPDTVANVILSRTGGNPLFIEAVIRSLQENRGLTQSGGSWELDAGGIRVPDQIESVILARIDQLKEASRKVLHTAAVIGSTFEYHILGAVLDVAQREQLDSSLSELAQRHLIVEMGGWWPNLTYAFRHSLIHQVTYTHLLTHARRAMHRLVAQVLRQMSRAGEEGALERLAHHYYHSDDRVNAVRYGLQAARRAADAWANKTAQAWYDHILETIRSFDTTAPNDAELAQGGTPTQILLWHVEALSGQGEVMVSGGHNTEAIADYEQALRLAAHRSDFPLTRWADLYHKLASAYHNQGAFVAAQDALSDGLRILGGQACVEAGRLYIWMGLLHYRSGRLPEGLRACEQGIALIEPAESPRDLAQAYNLLGIIHRNLGDPQRALPAHQRSIALYEQIKYWPGLERANSNLGCVYQDLGRWDEALQCFQKSAGLSEQTGEERQRAAAHINLGEIYYLKGELDQAVRACGQARQIAEAFGFQDYLAIISLNLGKALLKAGQLAQARDSLEASLEICQRLRSDVYRPEILRHLALLNLAEGQFDSALTLAQEAMTLAEKMGRRETGQGHRVLGQVYRALGQFAEADAHLRQSLANWEEQNSPYEAGLALVELAALCHAQAETGEAGQALRVQGAACCDRAIQIFENVGASLDLALAREVRRVLLD